MEKANRSAGRIAGLLLSGVLPILALAASAQAQISFTPENRTIFSSMTALAVTSGGPGFRMYLSSGNFAMVSATSTDQVAWSLEGGTRLSTGAINGYDASSITACGLLVSTTTPSYLRMYYVGIDSAGFYSVLSASSTDGLAWFKEPGARLQKNGGKAFLDSPEPLRISSTAVRLFYIADSRGANSHANYRVFTASSTDGGVTFAEEGALFSTAAFHVSVTTLTDARVRLYFSQPAASSGTAAMVKSALASGAASTSFSLESDNRLSTNPATSSLFYPVVVRSTESFRWRMFLSYTEAGSTTPFLTSALTLTPIVLSLSPRRTYFNQSSMSFTINGEIFGPSPAVSFVGPGSTMTAFSVARPDDLTITGSFNPFNQPNGLWDAVVANYDGYSASLRWALTIETPPGEISILDNLFRPLKGGSAKITVKIYEAGNVTARLYTINGGLVATLYDGPAPAGNTTFTWFGKTSLGNTVASGLYLLRLTGPAIDTTQRIVVIK